jgi:outer membrane protein TolC
MPDSAPMTYGQAEHRLTEMAKRIRAAEGELDRAYDDAADAESVYRRALADALDRFREEGLAVEHAQMRARAECFVLSGDRDKANGRVRRCLEVLEDRRGERESLHRLVAWSHSLAIRD